MDDATIAVYEGAAGAWRERREVKRAGAAARLAAASGGLVVDLGCGPGWQLPHLGPGAIGLDASAAMLDLARSSGSAALVRADLEALPFRRGGLGGAWASRSYIHVERHRLPLALADLHRSLAVGAPVEISLFAGDFDLRTFAGDDFAGRRFTGWTPESVADVMAGAGFESVTVALEDSLVVASGTRARTLPDYVGPGLRLLACGLNPSLHAADAGYGYAGPSNRFWKAVEAAGLVSALRDPRRMVTVDRVGMTCLVKRASPRADELTTPEYRAGAARLERLVRWLEPGVVVFVGLAGYRAAIDRTAKPGLQSEPFGGRPAYVLPSTSGLNAGTSLATLVDHFRAAAALA